MAAVGPGDEVVEIRLGGCESGVQGMEAGIPDGAGWKAWVEGPGRRPLQALRVTTGRRRRG